MMNPAASTNINPTTSSRHGSIYQIQHHGNNLPTTTTTIKDPHHGHHHSQINQNLQNVDYANPIFHNYDLLNFVGVCGPENCWKLYSGWRRVKEHYAGGSTVTSHGHSQQHQLVIEGGRQSSIGGSGGGIPNVIIKERERKEVTLFIYEKRLAEKLHKPKRKETIAEILRSSYRQLERFRHPKILQVLSPLEESSDSLAFATEPLIGCLSSLINNYEFLELELKYGLLNISEGLQYLHYSGHVIHRNINPGCILINKRGVWKLGGMEFMEKCPCSTPEPPIGGAPPHSPLPPHHHPPSTSSLSSDYLDPLPCTPWTSRLPKMGQPDLDYIAPEIQLNGNCSILSDMFSLGLLIGYIYGGGVNLIKAKNSSSNYGKMIEQLDSELSTLLPSIPPGLQEAVTRLLSKEPRLRPTSQLLSLIKYFSDPIVHALQFLDVISMKDPVQKAGFYRNGLRDVLEYVPKKLWFHHIWPILNLELRTTEVLAAALQPILYIIENSSQEEFNSLLLNQFKCIISTPKSIQATVTLLENLHFILEKSLDPNLNNELLNLLYNSYDSSTLQVQNAVLIATSNCCNYLNTNIVRSLVISKIKFIYSKYPSDTRIILNVLKAIDVNIEKLERGMIIEDVLPILLESKLQDGDVCGKVVQIYRRLLSSKQYGLSINLLATRVIPSLTPQTINPNLSLEQFTSLIETIQEMLDTIERNQRNKLKLDCLNPNNVTLLGNVSRRGSEIVSTRDGGSSRKASSAEDVGNRQLLGANEQIITSLSTSTTPTSENFLRVQNQNPAYRRLSDNTLLPSIKLSVDELPIRRHSSTGPEGSSNRKNSVAVIVQNAGGINKPTSASASAIVNTSSSSRRQSTIIPATNILTQLGSGIGAFLHKNIPR